MAQVLRQQRMNYDIDIWSRGVDRDIFDPSRRDLQWRQALGIDDDMPVIGFLGRLVMEKGLDVFSDTIDQLKRRNVRHKVVVVGEGPRAAGLKPGCPMPPLWVFRAERTLRAQSPAWTCCSIPA